MKNIGGIGNFFIFLQIKFSKVPKFLKPNYKFNIIFKIFAGSKKLRNYNLFVYNDFIKKSEGLKNMREGSSIEMEHPIYSQYCSTTSSKMDMEGNDKTPKKLVVVIKLYKNNRSIRANITSFRRYSYYIRIFLRSIINIYEDPEKEVALKKGTSTSSTRTKELCES